MNQAATTPHIRSHAEALSGVVVKLAPEDVPASQAPGMWSAFDRIERLAASAKILLARRVDDSKIWQRQGHRSPAGYLAHTSGNSIAASRGTLQTSKRIVELPQTEAALRSGELSVAQAEAIADAASHNPHAERKLLDTAKRSSLAELRDACARAKAASDPDPDATYRRIHENRYQRQRRDSESGWNLTARGTPDAGALFNSSLNPIIDDIFHTAWAEGRREERQQHAFDALLEMARRARDGYNPHADAEDADADPDEARADGSSQHARREGNSGLEDRSGTEATDSGSDASQLTDEGGDPDRRRHTTGAREPKKRKRRDPTNPTYLALLRIDFAALLRGHIDGEETCEIAGIGPIPVARAAELLGDSVLKLIATKGTQVANVTHYGRKPTVAQRMALLWSQPTCSVQGCNHTFAQTDHRVDWHHTHHTRLDELDRLCDRHHKLKTNHGWALVEGTGKRPMVAPNDARHPDNQPTASGQAA